MRVPILRRAAFLIGLTAFCLIWNPEILGSATYIHWCEEICDPQTSCAQVCKIGYGEDNIIGCASVVTATACVATENSRRAGA